MKAATEADHGTLDRLVSRWDLSQQESYADFLRLHSALVPPLENWLAACGAAALLPDWPMRQRTDALLSDLRALSLPPLEPVPVALEPCLPSAAGVLYVLEGSRLGGKVLARRAAAAETELPASFLLHGADQRLWQSFLNWLNGQNFSIGGKHRAITSARAVFSLYSQLAASLLKEPVS
ncbi:biliverdin-producing heme oxygenase [Roseobacteraceae bacterium NS-SX3]